MMHQQFAQPAPDAKPRTVQPEARPPLLPDDIGMGMEVEGGSSSSSAAGGRSTAKTAGYGPDLLVGNAGQLNDVNLFGLSSASGAASQQQCDLGTSGGAGAAGAIGGFQNQGPALRKQANKNRARKVVRKAPTRWPSNFGYDYLSTAETVVIDDDDRTLAQNEKLDHRGLLHIGTAEKIPDELLVSGYGSKSVMLHNFAIAASRQTAHDAELVENLEERADADVIMQHVKQHVTKQPDEQSSEFEHDAHADPDPPGGKLGFRFDYMIEVSANGLGSSSSGNETLLIDAVEDAFLTECAPDFLDAVAETGDARTLKDHFLTKIVALFERAASELNWDLRTIKKKWPCEFEYDSSEKKECVAVLQAALCGSSGSDADVVDEQGQGLASSATTRRAPPALFDRAPVPRAPSPPLGFVCELWRDFVKLAGQRVLLLVHNYDKMHTPVVADALAALTRDARGETRHLCGYERAEYNDDSACYDGYTRLLLSCNSVDPIPFSARNERDLLLKHAVVHTYLPPTLEIPSAEKQLVENAKRFGAAMVESGASGGAGTLIRGGNFVAKVRASARAFTSKHCMILKTVLEEQMKNSNGFPYEKLRARLQETEGIFQSGLDRILRELVEQDVVVEHNPESTGKRVKLACSHEFLKANTESAPTLCGMGQVPWEAQCLVNWQPCQGGDRPKIGRNIFGNVTNPYQFDKTFVNRVNNFKVRAQEKIDAELETEAPLSSSRSSAS
eukprot:g8611.t1